MEIRFAYKLLLEPIPFQSSVGKSIRVRTVSECNSNRIMSIWKCISDRMKRRTYHDGQEANKVDPGIILG